MFKIFLSYAHVDVEFAMSVYRRLVGRGNTVWMDDARPDASHAAEAFVGVPAGESHRTVIENAIGLSATFLICDSPAWRASEYCREELVMARNAGTRIAVLSDPNLSQLLSDDQALANSDLDHLSDQLQERIDSALAHVRFRADMKTAQGRKSWKDLILGETENLRDARLILASRPTPDSPRISEDIRSRAQSVVVRAAMLRRRRRRISFGLIAILLVLALLSIGASARSTRDSTRARELALNSQSIDIASQSLRAMGWNALSLAKDAWELDQNPESQSALSVARCATEQIVVNNVTPIVPARQVSGLPGERWLVNNKKKLILFDRFGNTIDRQSFLLAVDDVPLVISGDEAYVLSSVDDHGNRTLQIYSAGAKSLRFNFIGGARVIGSGPDGEVWIVTDSGDVGLYNREAFSVDFSGTITGEPTAIAATASSVSVLNSEGLLQSLLREGSQLSPLWTLDLSELSVPIPEVGPADPDQPATDSTSANLNLDQTRAPGLDRLIWCGEQLHVLIGQQHEFATIVTPNPRHISLHPDGTPASPFGTMKNSSSFACQTSGALLGMAYGRTKPAESQPGQAVPISLVSSSDRFRSTAIGARQDALAAMTDLGELRITGSLTPTVRQVGGAYLAWAVQEGVLLQDLIGNLWLINGSEPASFVGTLNTPLARPKTRGTGAVATSGRTLFQLDSSGIRNQWLQPERIDLLELADDGMTAVLLTETAIRLQPLSDASAVTVPIPELNLDETIQGLALDGSAIFVRTNQGRVLRLNEDGSVRGVWGGERVSGFVPRPGPSEGVVVASRDGVLRLLDGDLNQLAARPVGALGKYIDMSDTTGLIAVATQASKLLVLDGETLELTQVESAPSPDDSYYYLLSFGSAGDTLITFRPYLRTSSNSYGQTTYVNMNSIIRESVHSGTYPQKDESEDENNATLESRPLCKKSQS
ncbi:MAG: toll/interleukin-1 receptor domain-containing protein [Acidobacteriota bacterium]|nr:toll/interleukin-1 receptor domain-containing protein [Acidobacteriota bacterium]